MHPSLARPFAIAGLLSAFAFASAATPQEQANALLDKGEFLAAERLIEPLALAKHPDPVAVWQLSRVRTGQHQGEEAVRLAEKAIKLDPSQARFHSQLGAALIERMTDVGRLDQGTLAGRVRKAFERALKLDPNHVPALAGLARYYYATPPTNGGDLTKAQEFAERARKLDPFQGELALGSIAGRRGDFAAALQHFAAAADLRPDDAEAQFSCGLALVKLGRRDEARARFETVLRLAPKMDIARQSLEAIDRANQIDGKH